LFLFFDSIPVAYKIHPIRPIHIATITPNPNHILYYFVSLLTEDIASKRKTEEVPTLNAFFRRAREFPNACFISLPLNLGHQCNVRFYFWIGDIVIRPSLLFIPDEVFTPQFKKPVMNHPIVMNLNGSYMPLYIFIPYLLRGVTDVL
jgi:hypothetical protein